MMKSEGPAGRRVVLLVLVTLLCFEGLFHGLYTPSFFCNNDTALRNTVAEDGKEKSTRPASTRRNQDREQDEEQEEQETMVLLWKWPFGNKLESTSCYKLFHITGCHVTDDRRDYEKAHGVMFHHRDIQGNLPELLRMTRPPLQKWAWMNMESPGNSWRVARLDGLFNLTVTYRRDSDIWVPYGRMVAASEEKKTFPVPQKDKLVCWIANNWNPQFRRVQYFRELQKHIQIHTYGRAFKQHLSLDEYYKTLTSCKFYLSFENSIYQDYLTEKLFNPMKVGTVPVVLGPSRENYEEFVPADSFIHVDDFNSPQELAEHLKLLDQNQDIYERFFTWRQHFTVENVFFGVEHACRICDHIKKHNNYRVVKNLSKWYWG